MVTNVMASAYLKTVVWPVARTVMELFKLRVAALLTFVAIATAFVAAEGRPPLGALGVLALAGLLSASGSAALNHYFDRDIDAVMPRTRNRPIPSGRVAPGVALALGLSLVFLSLPVALTLNPWLALFVALGATFYIPVYTLILKRRTWLNIVIGGAAGSFASLAGWAAIHQQVTPAGWLIAALLFCWTPPHFWAFALVHADAYRKANVPMLPVVVGQAPTIRWIFWHALFLALLSAGLGGVARLGPIYGLAALAGNAQLIRESWRLRRVPSSGQAWRMYKTSSMYLGYLCLGMLIDTIIW